MDSGDDVLSVIFLALVCIVIAGIVRTVTPSGMMMPTFSLIAICLWIAYDYMLQQRYKAKKACLNKDKEIQEANEQINKIASELNNDVEEQETEPVVKEEAEPVQKHQNEFDISMFNAATIPELHTSMGCSGDTQISNRMKYMGLQAKLSQDIRARHNMKALLPYFDEELKANENRDWWDAEQDHLDAYM